MEDKSLPLRLTSDPLTAQTREVVAKAAEIAQRGDIRSAIEFLTRFGDPKVHLAAQALLANHFLKDDQRWLHHLNLYLRPYNVAAIELKPGKEKKFHRLHATPQTSVNDGPLTTIIVPAFNAAQTLETSIRSLIAQTWRSLEIIIVDDSSVDDTQKIAQRLAKEDARIRVFRNAANAGPYTCRNLALPHARGEYITCHDADDWAFPERIEMEIAAMNSNDLDAVLMRSVRMTEDGFVSKIGGEGYFSHDGVLKTSHISVMFRGEVLKTRLGNWDTMKYGADGEMIARTAIALGPRFIEVIKPCMFYLDQPRSLSNNPKTGTLNQISPIRMEYRKRWGAWHDTLSPSNTFLGFPLVDRPYEAPRGMAVPLENIMACLKHMPAPKA